MPSHQEIDQRSLALARAVAAKIDEEPFLLEAVKEWACKQDAPAYREWMGYLEKPWEDIRKILLDSSEDGVRLRQSSPFVGVLSPQERWKFFPTKKV